MDLFVGNADPVEYMDVEHASGKRKRFGRRLKKLWIWARRQHSDDTVDSSAPPQPRKPGSGTPEDIKRLSAQLRLPDRSLSRQSREGRTRSPEPGQTASLENTVTPRPRPRSSTTPPPVSRISVASSNGTESDLEWPIRPPPRKRAATAERVVKPIRMRVHFSCHLCNSSMSGNSICSNPACQHRRCNRCERDSDRRVLRADEINAIVVRELEQHDAIKDIAVPIPKMFSTTLPLGGLPPGKQPPQPHRVRCICARVCHRCYMPFVTAEHLCQQCGHILCLKCPKDPPRAGTEDDPPQPTQDPAMSNSTQQSPRPSNSNSCLSERVHRRPRIRVRYQCEQCHKFYEENSKICSCGHVRCETCPRDPPRRSSDVSSTPRPSTSSAPRPSTSSAPRPSTSSAPRPSTSSATIVNAFSNPPSLRSTPSLPNTQPHPTFCQAPRYPRSQPPNPLSYPSMPNMAIDREDPTSPLPPLPLQRDKLESQAMGRMTAGRETFAEVNGNGRLPPWVFPPADMLHHQGVRVASGEAASPERRVPLRYLYRQPPDFVM